MDYTTRDDTLVVRVGTETKLELAERARENDRSLSAETRRALREYLERDDDEHEEQAHEQ